VRRFRLRHYPPVELIAFLSLPAVVILLRKHVPLVNQRSLFVSEIDL
jgi:hypothetical protein